MSFLKVLSTNLGVSKKEYERMLYLALIKAKVVQEIDINAVKVSEQVERLLSENGGDFAKVKETLGDSVQYENTGGLVDSKNVDGGRAAKAESQNVGQISARFLSTNGDGYYFVKTTEKKEGKVAYESLYVKFTEFDDRLKDIREEGKVKEYINLPEQSQNNS